MNQILSVSIEKSKKGDFKIIYKCDKCGMITKNIKASDDNMEEIIRLSVTE